MPPKYGMEDTEYSRWIMGQRAPSEFKGQLKDDGPQVTRKPHPQPDTAVMLVQTLSMELAQAASDLAWVQMMLKTRGADGDLSAQDAHTILNRIGPTIDTLRHRQRRRDISTNTSDHQTRGEGND